MMKIGSGSASGSISQRHGSADPDPDPHQNVMDQQHCFYCLVARWSQFLPSAQISPPVENILVHYL
jgi:hypothetical protein